MTSRGPSRRDSDVVRTIEYTSIPVARAEWSFRTWIAVAIGCMACSAPLAAMRWAESQSAAGEKDWNQLAVVIGSLMFSIAAGVVGLVLAEAWPNPNTSVVLRIVAGVLNLVAVLISVLRLIPAFL